MRDSDWSDWTQGRSHARMNCYKFINVLTKIFFQFRVFLISVKRHRGKLLVL